MPVKYVVQYTNASNPAEGNWQTWVRCEDEEEAKELLNSLRSQKSTTKFRAIRYIVLDI